MKRYSFYGTYTYYETPTEDVDGAWIRYSDHCEAMKRIAGAAVEQGPRDADIEAWAEGFIRAVAYNRSVAVQIATEAAKWVRSVLAANRAKKLDGDLLETIREAANTKAEGAITKDGRAVFINYGDSEQQMIDAAAVACPACGGSGHVGDVSQDMQRVIKERLSPSVGSYANPIAALSAGEAQRCATCGGAKVESSPMTTGACDCAIEARVRSSPRQMVAESAGGAEPAGISFDDWFNGLSPQWKAVIQAEGFGESAPSTSPAALTNGDRGAIKLAADACESYGLIDTAERLRALLAAQPPAAAEAEKRDAERYRFIKASMLILSGGHRKFGWPVSPFGEQCDRYLDAAMSASKEGA